MVRDELVHRRKQWAFLAAATALTLPGLAVFVGVFGHRHPPGVLETILFGLAITGAAFLLSWAAEVAQLDISQGLAIAFLAFIAVLPEYAVDLVFSWKAGRQDRLAGIDPCLTSPECTRQLAIANMTGANRLLIGLGWAVVVLVWWRKSQNRSVQLPVTRRTDIGFMFIATAWALKIVVLNQIDLIDTAVLLALFALYVWHAAKEESEHPELIGPPLAIAALSIARRRGVTIALFLYAAAVILVSAEPFAEGLVHTGESLGVSKFLLVQWLAPLASESPEMIIAILFVLRLRPEQGLGALVSSKVNQWTLLVGTLPLVYAIAFGSASHPLHLGGRQVEEVLLTAAQSLFAAAVLANLSISRGEAAGLLFLFIAQFGFQSTTIRYGFATAYLILFVVLVLKDAESRRGLALAVRQVFSKPGFLPEPKG